MKKKYTKKDFLDYASGFNYDLDEVTDKNGKMSFTNDYSDFINMKNKAKEEGVIP